MMATGEPQTPAPQLDSLELAELLQRKVAGEAFPYTFVHEVSPYSAAPEDLVRGLEHAPGTGQAGDGKGMAWYFCSTANCHESAGGAPRRNRQVGRGRDRSSWHPEGGKKLILGRDRKPVGAYWRTLSYVLKTKNPTGAKKSFRKRLGWCMLEIGLEQQDGGAGHQHQLVLCKVYRSPRSTADPAETSRAAAGAEDVGPPAGTGISGVEDGQRGSALEGGAIPEEPLDVYRSPHADAEASVPSGGMPCLTPFECGNQSMELAMEDGRPVIAENSYSHQAPAGTVITRTRDTTKSILTSIELKRNVTILDIEKTSTLDQDAFVLVVKASSIFQSFEDLGISVDWVATSEGKMSFTLVPSQLLSQEVIQPALDKAVQNLQKIATVDRLQDRSVISLIGNPPMSIVILGKVLDVLGSNNITVEKVRRGSPKVANVSLVVHDSAAERCVQLLHSAFFELNGCPVPVNSSGAASSSDKRKADDGHPEAPPGVRQELEELERWLSEDIDGDPVELFDCKGRAEMQSGEMARVDGGYNNNLVPGGMDDNFLTVEYQSGPGLFESLHSSDPAQELVPLRRRVQSDEEQEHLIFHAGKESSTWPRRLWLLDSVPSSDPAQVLVPLRRRVQSEEEQELTEAEESSSELGSVTGEMERSHQESTTNQDGRGLGGFWVRRLAIVKRSMPSAGHCYSLRFRLAACLFDIGLRLLTKQTSME